MAAEKIKQSVDDYLNKVDYEEMKKYKPSEFAITFINFIKLANGGAEANVNPPVHYKMIDGLRGKRTYLANLCSRGLSKAVALGTKIITPTGLVPVENINVGDTVYDIKGKPCTVLAGSEIFHKDMYRITLTNGEYFDVSKDHINIVERDLDTYWVRENLTTEDILNIGFDNFKWYIPLVENPIEFTNTNPCIDPYTVGVLLNKGSINSQGKLIISAYSKDELDSLLTNIPYRHGEINLYSENSTEVYTELLDFGSDIIKYLSFERKERIPTNILFGSIQTRIDCLRGLMDTEGSISKFEDYRYLTYKKDLADDIVHLVKSLGGYAFKKEIKAIHPSWWEIQIDLFSINPFKIKSKSQQWKPKAKDKSSSHIQIKSIEPIPIVPSRCLKVSSPTESFLIEGCIPTHNTSIFAEYLIPFLAIFRHIPEFGEVDTVIYIADSMENGAKNLRKNIEARYSRSDFLQKFLPNVKFTDAYMEFENIEGKKFGVKLYGAKSGIRGVKMFGKRPVLAILDDIVSDEDANSPTMLEKIKDTIYKGVIPALDPNKRKVVFNGTPFNKRDPLYEAVESGEWYSNVYPVCEQFPCEEKDFRGAWEDRFGYEAVLEQYNLAVGTGQIKAFRQELMLRITSDEDKVIFPDDIRWFKSTELLKNQQQYNFVITTDFATSTQRKADYTVIGVWALDSNGNRYLVDGKIGRQLMNQTFDDLFSLAKKYNPMAVGIEVSGQQGAFIALIREEMIKRNFFFTLARSKESKKEGIPARSNKMERFRLSIPYWKNGKMYLPEDLKHTKLIQELLDEINLVTIDGIKSKNDDVLDMISQLEQMYLVYPDSTQANKYKTSDSQNVFFTDIPERSGSSYSDYLV